MAIHARYANAMTFSDELAWVEVDGKWSLISPKGRHDVPLTLEPSGRYKPEPFRKGLARVYIDGRVAYVNRYGRMVFEEQ